MKTPFFYKIIMFLLVIFPFSIASAQNEQTSTFNNALLSGLDYPELQVAPRASERLQSLSQWEDKTPLLTQWTLLTSGVATFVSGLQMQGNYRDTNLTSQEKRTARTIAQIGQTTGLIWIGVSSYLMYQKPMVKTWSSIAKTNPKDKRQDLTRERLAEEALEAQSQLQDRLEGIAIASNFITSVAMFSEMHDDQKPYAIASILTSTLPWLIESEYIRSYNKHREAKRKIYAPLVSLDPLDPKTPKLVLTWNY